MSVLGRQPVTVTSAETCGQQSRTLNGMQRPAACCEDPTTTTTTTTKEENQFLDRRTHSRR